MALTSDGNREGPPFTDVADVEVAVLLARVGLAQEASAGLRETLHFLSDELSALGCVVLEATPGSCFEPERQSGTLFAVAQWFKGDAVWHQHGLPAQSSVGYAVARGVQFECIGDLAATSSSNPTDFAPGYSVRSACVVPLSLRDGAKGALVLYRSTEAPCFSEHDCRRAYALAQLLPVILDALNDRIAYQVTCAINSVLRQDGPTNTEEGLCHAIQDVCAIANKHFAFREISVFLQPQNHPAEPIPFVSLRPNSHDSSLEPDLLPLGPLASSVLAGGDVRIFDLRHPSSDEEQLISDASRPFLAHILDIDLPVSLMATPVMSAGRVLGVIRCTGRMREPYWYSDSDLRLLRLVSGEIGWFVSHVLAGRALVREKESYGTIVDGVSSMVDLLQTEFDEPLLHSEQTILSAGLENLLRAIPSASFMDILIEDGPSASQTLRRGQGWPHSQRGSQTRLPEEWARQLQRGSPVVLNEHALTDPKLRDYLSRLPSSPGVLLLSPFASRGRLGYLEIGFPSSASVPQNAISIARVWAKQITVYQDLLAAVAELKEARASLKAEADSEAQRATAQARAFMDLEHQVRAPLRHAQRRIPLAIRMASQLGANALLQQLLFLRGILRRAVRVAANARLFSSLATGQAVETSQRPHSYEEIRKLLIESIMDHQLLSDETRSLTFRLDDDKLRSRAAVSLDRDLLDQAVSNLLDNASKYSYDDTAIVVEVGQTSAYFTIAVVNRGLTIRRDEIQEIVKRGERGTLARSVVAEGSGIGLWIVDEVMQAHRGRLEIQPTTPDHVTRIRLLFPIERQG